VLNFDPSTAKHALQNIQMIATSGFLTALECIKFVLFSAGGGALPRTPLAVAYLPLDHLGHGPPLNSEKFLHMAKKCNIREVRFSGK